MIKEQVHTYEVCFLDPMLLHTKATQFSKCTDRALPSYFASWLVQQSVWCKFGLTLYEAFYLVHSFLTVQEVNVLNLDTVDL